MLYSRSRKLLIEHNDRLSLFKELDSRNIKCVNHNSISHLIDLLQYNFTDEQIIEYMQNYINSSLKFKTSHTKDSYIAFYGEIVGTELYNKHIINVSNSGKESYKNGRKVYFDHFFPEYWINKGYSESEALEKVNERKNKAKKKSKEAIDSGKRTTNTQIKYYIDKGANVEEAKLLLKERQNTRSLNFFKSLYGEELGLIKFNESNAKWQKSLNDKTDEEKQRIYELRVNGFAKAHRDSVSKEETEILKYIEDKCNIKIERQFKIVKDGKAYLFDGKYKNILIEFNGDFWHCNPKLYEASYMHPIKKMYAKDVWKYDEYKNNEVAKNYYVFVIWENELNDRNKIIERFKLYL